MSNVYKAERKAARRPTRRIARYGKRTSALRHQNREA